MEGYNYTKEIEVRFGDLNTADHVHNVVFDVYLEEARIGWFKQALGKPETSIATLIVHQEIDYKAVIDYEDKPVVGVRATGLGDTSLELEYEIQVNGETAAIGKTVQVIVNDEDEPIPIPDEWREKIRRYDAESLG